MNEKIKITDEELNSIQTLQTKYHEIRGRFGDLYLEKMAIDIAIKSITDKETQIVSEYKELQKQETVVIEAILKKYGEGSLDIKNGFFVPESNPPKTP